MENCVHMHINHRRNWCNERANVNDVVADRVDREQGKDSRDSE